MGNVKVTVQRTASECEWDTGQVLEQLQQGKHGAGMTWT